MDLAVRATGSGSHCQAIAWEVVPLHELYSSIQQDLAPDGPLNPFRVMISSTFIRQQGSSRVLIGLRFLSTVYR